MNSTLENRIQKELRKIQRKINKVHDAEKKAKLIHAYVDLLESLDVKEFGS